MTDTLQDKLRHNARVLAASDGWTKKEKFLVWQAADEIERLRDALNEIAVGEGVYGAQAFEYKNIARRALDEPLVGQTSVCDPEEKQ